MPTDKSNKGILAAFTEQIILSRKVTGGREITNDIIAYCGVICNECLACETTQKDDDVKRKEIAERWNTQYGFNLKTEDINCDGCLQTNGRLVKCCITCEPRNCGLQRDVTNCAYCDEYPCHKLISMVWFDAKCKPSLDRIRESLRK